ncbi:MAG: LD-carboxypeptidase [Alphaproteobacteria bacterium]|nr:LD-carboxypeptidase [Alphaproteobacteria bacterium]
MNTLSSAVLPPPLKPGARIGVFAPSGAFNPERVAKGCDLIRGWGFEPVEAPNLGGVFRYLAGTDVQRTRDMVWALTDPGLDAAWMARGGYGLTRLLRGGLPERLPPRPVIGFSDGTALMSALWQRGVVGVHGPVLHSVADLTDPPSQDHLRALLGGDGAAQLDGHSLVKGEVTAPLVGGNLCMLASTCGTPLQLDARGCILLLEDVSEPPYKLDRTLEQLDQAGVFEGVVGVALGDFVGSTLPTHDTWTIEDVLMEHIGRLEVPVVAGLPVGHGARNRAFLHGAPATLTRHALVLEDPR